MFNSLFLFLFVEEIEMNSEDKLFFKGIYGDDSINMVRETIHIATLGSSEERKNSFIKLHSHNDLFQIFVIETGRMDLLLDDQEIPIESVSFFLFQLIQLMDSERATIYRVGLFLCSIKILNTC